MGKNIQENLDGVVEIIRPKKLIYKDVGGAGKQIHADIDSEFDMAEFRKLPGVHMIASEAWIQFEPKEWAEMQDQIFREIVDAWNEKHGS